MLGKAMAEIERQSKLSFQPPTVMEVEPFPSCSLTLDKDSVGEHEKYFKSLYCAYLHCPGS